MNKKLVLIFVVLVLVFFAVGGVWWYRNKSLTLPGILKKESTSNQNNSSAPLCPAGDALCSRVLAVRAAVEAGDLKRCESFEADTRLRCITEIALKQSNDRFCLKVQDPVSQAGCTDMVLMKKAREKSDVSLCSKINDQGSQAVCFSFGFSQKNDASFCQSMGSRKDECVSIVLARQAYEKQDSSLCAAIPVASTREACSTELSPSGASSAATVR